jgi:hypothetical protein
MERKEVGTRIKAVLAPDDRINQMQFRANLTLPDYGRVPVCSGIDPRTTTVSRWSAFEFLQDDEYRRVFRVIQCTACDLAGRP